MVYGSYEQVANLGAVVTLFKAVGYCGFWWSFNQIDCNFQHWASYRGQPSKWQFKVLQYRCYHNTVMTHLEGNTDIGLKVRLKVLFLFTLCLHSNFYTASSKGRVTLTNRMNFRKSSKRLLTPPLSFSESYIALFATKLWQKCVCSYGGTFVYFMILFPMRCM